MASALRRTCSARQPRTVRGMAAAHRRLHRLVRGRHDRGLVAVNRTARQRPAHGCMTGATYTFAHVSTGLACESRMMTATDWILTTEQAGEAGSQDARGFKLLRIEPKTGSSRDVIPKVAAAELRKCRRTHQLCFTRRGCARRRSAPQSPSRRIDQIRPAIIKTKTPAMGVSNDSEIP